MIPKIIHYCWFGKNEIPLSVKDCIESWQKHLPDYKIVRWDEGNFDLNLFPFAAEAYREKKYAFVSDVCRLFALKTQGGIYLDTDVEFIKPLPDNFLKLPAFGGFEDNSLLSSALIAAEKESAWINDLLKYYEGRSFYLPAGQLNMLPNTEIITKFMQENKGLVVNNRRQTFENYCTIFPSRFFSPKSWKTLKIKLYKNSYCIHHFSATWLQEEQSWVGSLANTLLGKPMANNMAAYFRRLIKNQ
jgi:mannosyltransferase OCH1-like enzyme